MKPINYSDFQPTRDYLQDISRVMGKVQQIFLKPDSHEWHKGLELTQKGIQTQELKNGLRLALDFETGQLQAEDKLWDLRVTSAQHLFAGLSEWAKTKGGARAPDVPEYHGLSAKFDADEANLLLKALAWASKQLTNFKSELAKGTTSPLLLYPHHFDVSFVWFAKNEGLQLTYGFSTGDTTIAEPYFYVTAYPELPGFTKVSLPQPALWQSKDFSGAVVTYNRLFAHSSPETLLQQLFATTKRAALL